MKALTYEYIRDEISKSSVIFQRGENAYSLGNDSLTEENPEEGAYRYSFDGSYGNYDVTVDLMENSVSSNCSCPFPHKGCKHVVTACLDIMNRRKRKEKEELHLIRGDQYIGPHTVRNRQYREYTVTLYDPSVRSGHCTCSDYATILKRKSHLRRKQQRKSFPSST